jgi:hypothetical protein
MAAAAVLAIAALSACGSSDDNSADEDAVTAAIDRAATSGDPAACTDAQTVRFVVQTSGGGGLTGEKAVKSCEKDAADSVSDAVDVTNVKVDGNTATAEAALTGGFIDGQTLNIALVNEGDQWKLDQITGFATFDRDAFIAAAGGTIEKEEPKAAACIKQQLESSTDQQLEDVVLKPDAANELFTPCFPGQ